MLKFSDPSPWLAAGALEQTNVRSRPPSKPQTSSTRTVRSRARRPLASARLPAHDRCKSQPSGTVAQEPGAPLIKPSTATINTRAIAAKKSSAESAPTAKARPLSPAGALFLLLPLVLFGDASSVFYLFNGREQMLKSRWRGGGGRRAWGQHPEAAPLVVDSTMRLFLPRCDDDVCPSAKSAVTKSVLIATNPPLWRASSGGRLLPLAAPNMMNKLQEARRARALRQDGCAKG